MTRKGSKRTASWGPKSPFQTAALACTPSTQLGQATACGAASDTTIRQSDAAHREAGAACCLRPQDTRAVLQGLRQDLTWRAEGIAHEGFDAPGEQLGLLIRRKMPAPRDVVAGYLTQPVVAKTGEIAL